MVPIFETFEGCFLAEVSLSAASVGTFLFCRSISPRSCSFRSRRRSLDRRNSIRYPQLQHIPFPQLCLIQFHKIIVIFLWSTVMTQQKVEIPSPAFGVAFCCACTSANERRKLINKKNIESFFHIRLLPYQYHFTYKQDKNTIIFPTFAPLKLFLAIKLKTLYHYGKTIQTRNPVCTGRMDA